MRIEVSCDDHTNRETTTLVLNGLEVPISEVNLGDEPTELVLAFFAGYSVAMADFRSALAAAEAHDHD